MAIFTGSGVAIVTPFKENKEVDFDKLGELIEFHIENKQMQLLFVEQREKRLH